MVRNVGRLVQRPDDIALLIQKNAPVIFRHNSLICEGERYGASCFIRDDLKMRAEFFQDPPGIIRKDFAAIAQNGTGPQKIDTK